MQPLPGSVDVAIVGGGTAGAAAAAACASRGLDVALLEAGELSAAGARWINGVPAWCFHRSGLGAPEGEELRGAGHAFHLVAGWGPTRVTIREHGVLEVDMRHLVARLQSQAREAGCHLVDHARATSWDGQVLTTSAGPVRARVVVDASGIGGAGLVSAPRVAPRDLCSATQQVRRVRDPAGARAFFAGLGVSLGETVCFTGIAGGYSIVNVRSDGDTISILSGAVVADGNPSGRALITRFAEEHPWVGDVIFGGSRAIPLRRPADRLVLRGVALLGDAGCQVFSAHGSGIGVQLVAAAELAETLAGGGDLTDWAVAWQRRWGGLLASYDVFRRFSQTLTVDDLRRLMDAGLMRPALSRAALAQQAPPLGLRLALAQAAAAVKAPTLVARMLPVVVRMGRVKSLYARYPSDPTRVDAWARGVSRLLRDGVAVTTPAAGPATVSLR